MKKLLEKLNEIGHPERVHDEFPEEWQEIASDTLEDILTEAGGMLDDLHELLKLSKSDILRLRGYVTKLEGLKIK